MRQVDSNGTETGNESASRGHSADRQDEPLPTVWRLGADLVRSDYADRRLHWLVESKKGIVADFRGKPTSWNCH